jgi:hypothetical protein
MTGCARCRRLRRLLVVAGLLVVLAVDLLQGGGRMDDGLIAVLLMVGAIMLLGLTGRRLRGGPRP